MKTRIELRQQAVAQHLQGRKKWEIARKLQLSRPWVDRWLDRYRPQDPALSLADRSSNTMHRLSTLQGRTPQEFAAHARLRYPPTDYDWRTRDLRLLKDKVTFIRFVRKSGRSTVTAEDKFLIGKKYKWHYVMAVVDVVRKRLNVICQGKRIRSCGYQWSTKSGTDVMSVLFVGNWCNICRVTNR